MKQLNHILGLAFLMTITIACQKNDIGGCDCENQPAGKKCKEIHYKDGLFIGYIEFVYDETGRIQQKTWHSDQSDNKESVYFYDTQGRLIKEDIRFGSGIVDRYREYSYNEFDSLSDESYYENGQLVSHSRFLYDLQGRLSIKSEFRDSLLLGSETFTYDQTGRLWRYERYDKESDLLEQRFFTYFSNGTEKISLYDGQRDYQGYIFIHRNEDNLIRERKQYNSDDHLSDYMLNIISGGRISRSTWYNAAGHPENRTLYLYY